MLAITDRGILEVLVFRLLKGVYKRVNKYQFVDTQTLAKIQKKLKVEWGNKIQQQQTDFLASYLIEFMKNTKNFVYRNFKWYLKFWLKLI